MNRMTIEHASRCLSKTVAEKLAKLKQGDNIVVLWVDAAISQNVPVKNKLSNYHVETTRSSSGVFHGIQVGELHQDQFILIVKGYVDQARMSVESIPLCLVKEIDLFQKTQLASVIGLRKTRIRYADGSVKEVRGGPLVVEDDNQRQRRQIHR